jgi:hypothetical protein
LQYFFAYIGLALTTSCLFALFTIHARILFSGLDTIFAILDGVITSCIVTLIVKFIFKRKAKSFTWRPLIISVVFSSIIVTGFLAWVQTRDQLKMFFSPNPVLSKIHVHEGRSILISSFVHFSAQPEVIVTVIQSRQLTSPTNDFPDSFQVIMEKSWDWWQPLSMAHPKFFMRHHKSRAVQGWTEALWINDATNEVYAYIGG